MPLITQDKRKPRAVKQVPEATDLNNLLGYCRLGFMPQWRRKEGRCMGENGERGATVWVRVWVLALPPRAPSSKGRFSPIARAWCSKALRPPRPPRLPPLSGAHQPSPWGLEPQACTPRELDWGPGEVCVAKITIKPFTQLSLKVPSLCLTQDCPLLASTWGCENSGALGHSEGGSGCTYILTIPPTPSTLAPCALLHSTQTLERAPGMGAGPPATSGTVTKGEVEGAPHRFQGDRRVLEDRLRAGALGVPTWKQKQEKVVLDEQKGTLTALPALAFKTPQRHPYSSREN